MFDLPSGATGKAFIRELTRLIESWTNSTEICEIALVKSIDGYASFIASKTYKKIYIQTT